MDKVNAHVLRELKRQFLTPKMTPFEEKIEKAYFRGFTTGGFRDYSNLNRDEQGWMRTGFDKQRWRYPRVNAVLYSEEFPSLINAAFPEFYYRIKHFEKNEYCKTCTSPIKKSQRIEYIL